VAEKKSCNIAPQQTDSCRLASISPIAYRNVIQEAQNSADQVTADNWVSKNEVSLSAF
jgi:hypothetical protein